MLKIQLCHHIIKLHLKKIIVILNCNNSSHNITAFENKSFFQIHLKNPTDLKLLNIVQVDSACSCENS